LRTVSHALALGVVMGFFALVASKHHDEKGTTIAPAMLHSY
jgi:hypothetical protein